MRGSGGGAFLHLFTRHYTGPTSARPDSITGWCPDPGAHPAVLNHRGRTCMHDCLLGVIDRGDDDCRLMSASARVTRGRGGEHVDDRASMWYSRAGERAYHEQGRYGSKGSPTVKLGKFRAALGLGKLK